MKSIPALQHKTWVYLRPRRGWAAINPAELWAHRELLFFLTLRDLKVRYKQTLLGLAWALLRPLLLMLLFSFIFSTLVQMDAGPIPYPLFVLAALLPWLYVADGLARAAQSVIDDQRLINRVYFPRLILPASAALAALADMLPGLFLLLLLIVFYGLPLRPEMLFLPLLLFLSLLLALGLGFWLSAFNVQYRDVRYAIPFLIQVWQYASPIMYPLHLVPPAWQALYSLNPMVALAEGFRWALLGTPPPSLMSLAASVCLTGALFLGGMLYFRRAERQFADKI
jgi:lipopolysaccharide transport system permease protein